MTYSTLKRLWIALLFSMTITAVHAAPLVEMTVASRGKVQIELYTKEAPKTTARFLDLCKSRFYNGILVHRMVPGFVVQAGDPKTKEITPSVMAAMSDEESSRRMIGVGGSGKNIPFERNRLTHEVGTLAMALSGPQTDTADSQWFINLVPNHRLDGDYCVFGKVTKGMDVVRKMQRGDKIIALRQIKK